MQKIMSMILSLTMILSLVTPVSATEMSEGCSENEQTIKLEDIVDANAVELESDTEVSDMKDSGQAIGSFEDEVIESSEDIDTSINDIENNSEESFDKDEQDIELPSYTIDDEMESYLEEYLNSLKKEEEYLDSETEQSLEEYLNSLISDEDLADSEENLEDGIYTADFSAYKTGTESSSSMAKYIDSEKSRIKVKNGKITVQLLINDSKTVVSTDATVNGEKVNTKRTDIDDASYIAEFKLNSIGDKIAITVDCDYSTIIPGMGVKTHDFDLLISDITYLEDLSEEEEKLKDGKYSIDFISNGTRHIKTSYLEVENGKMNVVITFSSGSSIEITNVKVNDNLIDNYYLSEVVNDALTIKIPVDALEDKINILMTIRVPSINMVHNYDISVENVSVIGDYVEVGDDSSEDSGDEPEDNIPEEDNKTLADGTYSIESVFLKANSTSTSAASSYFDSKSTLKVKDGKYTLILNVNQYITAFSNLSATVDGVTTKDVDLIKNSDGTGTISFSINSLSSSISVGCTLTVAEINYVNTTEFTVKLDVSTLKNENGESVEVPEEDKLPLNVDAIYTITNRVIAGENGTIPESARYLDASSSIEVKYGNIFATLVFNSSDFMDGRSITLNNNSSATPVSKISKIIKHM